MLAQVLDDPSITVIDVAMLKKDGVVERRRGNRKRAGGFPLRGCGWVGTAHGEAGSASGADDGRTQEIQGANNGLATAMCTPPIPRPQFAPSQSS